MAKLPAYGRELLDLRRFGDRRPKFNAVFVMDDWELARVHRERLRYCTLIVEPFEDYSFACCADLDVSVVMGGDARRVLRALRRARPRSLVCGSPDRYLDWLEWLVEQRTRRAA